MVYDIQEAIDILSRTANILQELLGGLAGNWVDFHKHDQAFSPSEVIGHLIAGEQTDWIPRMQIMLSPKGSKEFPPFDREGFDKHLGLTERLSQFAALREQNLEILKESITVEELHKTGIHPDFGEVTLQQHLATWVVHDMTHLFQIIEALALRYKDDVGPWRQYLRVLNV